MMTEERLQEIDIVTRLREGRSNGSNHRWTVTNIHREAADEIERLRAEVDRLREMLKTNLRSSAA